MNRKFPGILLAVVAVIGLSGCPHHANILNVTDAAVPVTKPNYALEDVRAAIIRAGAGLGWNVTDAGDNKMLAVLHLRSHVAKVEIPYSKTSFSILYKDSENLEYDGSKIHSNYNGWVQNLNRAINVQLSTL